MPLWTKTARKTRDSFRAKASRPAPAGSKRKKTSREILDPDWLSKYPWLMACDNVDLPRL